MGKPEVGAPVPTPRMTPIARSTLVAALAVHLPLLGGCDLVRRFVAGPPDEQLVEAALERWAAPGRPFLDGASGRDTVASVSPTGARAWEVAVVPPTGGAPVVWTLDVVRVETWPTFPGDAFGRFLQDRARELGMRTFIPPEMLRAMETGAIRGVGELEIRYGLAQRTGRNTETRIAFLEPGDGGREPRWRIQDVSRSANVLLEALRTVTGDMVHRDERVLTCMGSASPASVSRSVQLACVAEVWTGEFGAGG